MEYLQLYPLAQRPVFATLSHTIQKQPNRRSQNSSKTKRQTNRRREGAKGPDRPPRYVFADTMGKAHQQNTPSVKRLGCYRQRSWGVRRRREGQSPYTNGGDMEIRTPDLLHAMQALYQLSYIPISIFNLAF